MALATELFRAIGNSLIALVLFPLLDRLQIRTKSSVSCQCSVISRCPSLDFETRAANTPIALFLTMITDH